MLVLFLSLALAASGEKATCEEHEVGSCVAPLPLTGDQLLQRRLEQQKATGLEEAKEDLPEKLPAELVTYAHELHECFQEASSDAQVSKKRLQQLGQLANYEIMAKAKELDPFNVIPTIFDALTETAERAALAIVTEDFNKALTAAFGNGTPTTSTVKSFERVLENMASACGDPEDAQSVGQVLGEVLGNGSSMSDGAKKTAMFIVDGTWRRCQEEVMDLDFLAEHGGLLNHKVSCSSHVNALLSQRSAEVGIDVNHRIKQFTVLHSKQNALGHRLAEHMRKNGVAGHLTAPVSSAVLLDELRAAAKGNLSQVQLQGLRYLEDRHSETMRGFNRADYCGRMSGNHAQGSYSHCLCIDELPELVCSSKHSKELATATKAIMEKLERADAMMKAHKLSMESHNASRELGSFLPGPCVPMLECELCTAGNGCISASRNPFDELELKVVGKSTSDCLSGECKVSWGWPAGACAAKFELSMGAAVASCTNTDRFSTFSLNIAAKLCLGGMMSDIADVIGWDLCHTIASLKYYPFLGKLTGSIGIPIYAGPAVPPVVSAHLVVQTPVHQLSQPVRNYINNAANDAHAVRYMNLLCTGVMAGVPSQMKHMHSCFGALGSVKNFYQFLFDIERGSTDINLEVKVWSGTWVTVKSFDLN